MSSIVEQAVAALRMAGVALQPGLKAAEFESVEESFGFTFSEEHRDFLRLALPAGDRWPGWRSKDHQRLAERLDWPVDSCLFDVRRNGFWPRSWGTRPDRMEEALVLAREHLAVVPRLVPLYGHRFLPAAPAGRPAPVFSVYQTDVIYYGDDLADYVAYEFKVPDTGRAAHPRLRIPFWSDLAEGAEASDL